jgi:hypothetical protein
VSIEFACQCGKRYRVADCEVGRRYRCPVCHALIVVPPPIPSAAPIPPTPDEPTISLGINLGDREHKLTAPLPRRKIDLGSAFRLVGLAGIILAAGWLVREAWSGRHPLPGPVTPTVIASGILGPSLTPEQEVVRKKIVAWSNEPETLYFEKWYPVVIVDGIEVDNGPYGERVEPCDRLVRVIFRSTQPILGRTRFDSIYYLKGGRVLGWFAMTHTHDKLCDKYYPEE